MEPWEPPPPPDVGPEPRSWPLNLILIDERVYGGRVTSDIHISSSYFPSGVAVDPKGNVYLTYTTGRNDGVLIGTVSSGVGEWWGGDKLFGSKEDGEYDSMTR